MTPRGTAFTSPGSYVVYLCSGVFCWLGFSETLARGATAQLESATLIKGRGLHPALFPLQAAGTAWMLALVGFTGTLAIAPMAGATPSLAWLLLPLPVISLALFATGLALALAPVTVLVRDTVQVVHLLLPLAFWATPIVYEPAILPTWAREVQAWNPLLPGITGIHSLLLASQIPSARDWLLMAVPAIAALLLGLAVSQRLEAEVRNAL
jgi:ABC-type polysaccharide/polyol phosphate export permease